MPSHCVKQLFHPPRSTCLPALETGVQGNCPIEISPLGQKAGNFWANCDGQVARPVRAHLEAVSGTGHLGHLGHFDHLGHLGHQASGAKSCTAICHVAEHNHGILQLFNNQGQRAKRLAAGAQLVLRPFTSSSTPAATPAPGQGGDQQDRRQKRVQ